MIIVGTYQGDPGLRDTAYHQGTEILDGDPPQTRGSFTRAWRVAETLRVWHTITAESRL